MNLSRFAEGKETGPIQRARTVLVVDDDQVLSDSLARELARLNVATITATTPEAAEAVLRQQRPQLAFVDLQLGERSGLALIKRLQEIDPNLRTIAMSGMGQAAFFLAVARKAGVIGELHKPIDRTALAELVSRLLPT